MKKIITCLLLLCSILQFSKAQVNTFNIQLPHFIDFGVEPYHALQQTADRGYIISRGSTDSAYYTTFMHYNEIIKMGKTGEISWAKRLVTGKLDSAHTEKINATPVIQTSDGNFIVGTIMYDSLKLPQTCLLKLGKQGELIWSKKYITRDFGIIYGLKETGDKNIIVCGATADDASGKTYAMAFKTNANGDLNWKFKNVNTDSISGAFYSMTEIPGKGYVFAGNVNHSAMLVHTAFDGAVRWTKRFFNSVGINFVRSVIFTSDNSLLTTGWLDMNSTYGQLFFSKFDLDGNVKWAKQFPITGIYNGSFGSDLKEKNNVYYFTSYISNPIPSTVLGAISSTGEVQWSKQFYNTFHTFNYTPSTLDLTMDNGFVFSTEGGIPKGRLATVIIKTDSTGMVDCDSRDYALKLNPLIVNPVDDIKVSDFILNEKKFTAKLLDIKIREIVHCRTIGDPDVGINAVVADEHINYYPNPTTGIISINNLPLKTTVRIEIYNCLGSIVYASKIIEQATINLSSLPYGLYFAKLFTEEGMIAEQKIIKR
jgi:hypothetical protein